MLLKYTTDSVLRDIAFFADFSLYLFNDRRVLENHAVDVKEGPFLLRDEGAHAQLEIVNLLNTPLDRGAEPLDLPFGIFVFFFLDGVQIQTRAQYIGRAAAKARGY